MLWVRVIYQSNILKVQQLLSDLVGHSSLWATLYPRHVVPGYVRKLVKLELMHEAASNILYVLYFRFLLEFLP